MEPPTEELSKPTAAPVPSEEVEELRHKLASAEEERDALAGQIAGLRADHDALLNDCQVTKLCFRRLAHQGLEQRRQPCMQRTSNS